MLTILIAKTQIIMITNAAMAIVMVMAIVMAMATVMVMVIYRIDIHLIATDMVVNVVMIQTAINENILILIIITIAVDDLAHEIITITKTTSLVITVMRKAITQVNVRNVRLDRPIHQLRPIIHPTRRHSVRKRAR